MMIDNHRKVMQNKKKKLFGGNENETGWCS